MKGLTVRLPEILLDALRDESKAQNRSINGQVLQILQCALKERIEAGGRSDHSASDSRQGPTLGSPEEALPESGS